MKRSNAYWDKRSLQRMAEYHRGADTTIQTVTNAYDKAQKDIQSMIDQIFVTFGSNGQMDVATARKVLNQQMSNPLLQIAKREYPKIKDERIRRWMLARMNAPAYRARITRLEALKENAYLQSKIIADVEITAGTNLYIKTMKDAYHRTMFDVQKGIGLGFEFAAIPNPVIQNILKQPWAGKQFSERIWGNTDVLATQVSDVITAGFLSGVGTAQMSKELASRMNVGKHAANRLVRTETTYMANMAEMESYEEAEIDEYMFLATLDKKTSVICQKQDLKVYKVKDAMPGVNMPPMHPFCRSSTRGYFGPATLDNIQRRARNPATGKNELVPASMAYPEWKGKYAIAG